MRSDKLKATKRVETEVTIGDLSLAIVFDGELELAKSVGPVRIGPATDAAPAGAVVMPMMTAEQFCRVSEAVRQVMRGAGDMREACPVHGFVTSGYVGDCPRCTEEKKQEATLDLARKIAETPTP